MIFFLLVKKKKKKYRSYLNMLSMLETLQHLQLHPDMYLHVVGILSYVENNLPDLVSLKKQ